MHIYNNKIHQNYNNKYIKDVPKSARYSYQLLNRCFFTISSFVYQFSPSITKALYTLSIFNTCSFEFYRLLTTNRKLETFNTNITPGYESYENPYFDFAVFMTMP